MAISSIDLPCDCFAALVHNCSIGSIELLGWCVRVIWVLQKASMVTAMNDVFCLWLLLFDGIQADMSQAGLL